VSEGSIFYFLKLPSCFPPRRLPGNLPSLWCLVFFGNPFQGQSSSSSFWGAPIELTHRLSPDRPLPIVSLNCTLMTGSYIRQLTLYDVFLESNFFVAVSVLRSGSLDIFLPSFLSKNFLRVCEVCICPPPPPDVLHKFNWLDRINPRTGWFVPRSSVNIHFFSQPLVGSLSSLQDLQGSPNALSFSVSRTDRPQGSLPLAQLVSLSDSSQLPLTFFELSRLKSLFCRWKLILRHRVPMICAPPPIIVSAHPGFKRLCPLCFLFPPTFPALSRDVFCPPFSQRRF